MNNYPSTSIRKFSQISVRNATKALSDQHRYEVTSIQADDLVVLLSALGQALDSLEEMERRMNELQLTMMVIRQHV